MTRSKYFNRTLKELGKEAGVVLKNYVDYSGKIGRDLDASDPGVYGFWAGVAEGLFYGALLLLFTQSPLTFPASIVTFGIIRGFHAKYERAKLKDSNELK